jgi:UrcA family protein
MTMSITITRPIFSFLSAAVLAFGTSQALADPPSHPSFEPRVTVQFADLNVSTAAGVRVLYSRIVAAAYEVCSRGADWYPTEHWAQKDCLSATIDHVVAKLNLPILTALHFTSKHSAAPTQHMQPPVRSAG